MTVDEIRSRYSDRILDLLEHSAQALRDMGFQVPKPHFADLQGSKHSFWWTDAEDERRRWPKVLQLQFMAAVSEELKRPAGDIQFRFCIVDLQVGDFLGCRESNWVNRDDPELVEEAFVSIESRLPALLTHLRQIAGIVRG